MHATNPTTDAVAQPAEIAAVGAMTIGCFGLTAPFSGFHPAVSAGAGEAHGAAFPGDWLRAAAGAIGRTAAAVLGR